MKTLLAVLAVTLAPAHVRVAFLSIPVPVPAAWLRLAAENLVTAVLAVLGVRVIGRFRPTPWPRPVFGGGA